MLWPLKKKKNDEIAHLLTIFNEFLSVCFDFASDFDMDIIVLLVHLVFNDFVLFQILLKF